MYKDWIVAFEYFFHFHVSADPGLVCTLAFCNLSTTLWSYTSSLLLNHWCRPEDTVHFPRRGPRPSMWWSSVW